MLLIREVLFKTNFTYPEWIKNTPFLDVTGLMGNWGFPVSTKISRQYTLQGTLIRFKHAVGGESATQPHFKASIAF